MVGTEAKAAAAKYLRERNAAVAKYRGTTRFKEALKIIEKIIELDPQRRQECEREIATTLWAVDVAAKLDKPKALRTPAQYRDDLQDLAEKLQKIIPLAAKAIPPEYQIRHGKDSWIAEHLKRHLKEIEQAIEWIRPQVKGSPQLKRERIMAVDGAYLLLKSYGKNPTLYVDGPWTKLARVLLGDEGADLAKYLKLRRERLRPLVG